MHPLLTRIRELLGKAGKALGLGRPATPSSYEPESLKPAGPTVTLSPRCSMAVMAASGVKCRLKKWVDLPPLGRRDLGAAVMARARLEGPGQLTVLAAGERATTKTSGYVYCVQDYRPRTLRQYIQDLPGDCALHDGARIVRSLAMALARMHASGLVHGGLNPDLVFVETESGPEAGEVYLDTIAFSGMEFGQDMALTISDCFLGGRAFLAPEGMLGNRADELSDQYTLGLVAYYVFTKRSAHDAEGSSTTMKVRGMLSSSIPPPGRFRSDLPNRWDAAVIRLCSKQRERRYRSVDDFLNEVASVL